MKNYNQSLRPVVLMTFFTLIFLFSCNSGSKSKETTKSKEKPAGSNVEMTSDFKISLAQWSLHRTYFGGAIDDWQEFGRLLRESPDSLLQGKYCK